MEFNYLQVLSYQDLSIWRCLLHLSVNHFSVDLFLQRPVCKNIIPVFTMKLSCLSQALCTLCLQQQPSNGLCKWTDQWKSPVNPFGLTDSTKMSKQIINQQVQIMKMVMTITKTNFYDLIYDYNHHLQCNHKYLNFMEVCIWTGGIPSEGGNLLRS